MLIINILFILTGIITINSLRILIIFSLKFDICIAIDKISGDQLESQNPLILLPLQQALDQLYERIYVQEAALAHFWAF